MSNIIKFDIFTNKKLIQTQNCYLRSSFNKYQLVFIHSEDNIISKEISSILKHLTNVQLLIIFKFANTTHELNNQYIYLSFEKTIILIR